MKNKIRITSLLLAVIMLVSVVAMTSCTSLIIEQKGNYVTRGELEKLLEQSQGTVNNNITINSNGDSDLLAASRAVLSAVSVSCEFECRNYYNTYSAYSAGSGVIYKLDKASGDAYIITNFHVVYNENSTNEKGIAKQINVYLYGQEYKNYAIPATYVGGAMNYDLAVLKVEGSEVLKGSSAMEVAVADSNDVAILDTAIAVGNPEGLGISATVGNINVDSEEIAIKMVTTSNVSMQIALRVMRTDAAVNSGNSGGGLFNSKGELIGIVNAKSADTTVESIGYAIPSNVAKSIADNIIYYCNGEDKTSVYRCLLGVTVSPVECYSEFDTETGKVHKREVVAIAEINEGSLADEVFKVADEIKSITVDGKTTEVTRVFMVVDSMLNARVGSEVSFEIERDGVQMTIPVTITERTLTEVK